MIGLFKKLFGCAVYLIAATALGQSNDLQFSAQQILPATVLQTTSYRVNDTVSVADHQFHFNIETKYGDLTVTGIPLLEKRLSELRAIEEAAKLSGEKVAVSSAWKTIKQTPRGASKLLTDPLGSLGQVPRGFGRMASNFVDPVSRRAGSESRRKLAASLGVDSETRNPVLKQLLDQMVVRKFVGTTATKYALSAAVPGLGILSSMENTREVVATRSPRELLIEMDSEFIQLGVWKPVKDAFIQNRNWTLLEKLTFMDSYRKLAGVVHADTLLYLANQDVSEAAILKRLIEARLLVELHSRSPIKSISESGLPIALLQNGAVVGVCSIDYLTNSQQVQEVAAGFRKQFPTKELKLYSTGYVSPAARQTLEANKIEFVRPNFATRVGHAQPIQKRKLR